MRILITRAPGILGSHLYDRLLAEGPDVVGRYNFITGSPDNLAHLFGTPGFRFIEHDVTEFISYFCHRVEMPIVPRILAA